jgi:plastocyanin
MKLNYLPLTLVAVLSSLLTFNHSYAGARMATADGVSSNASVAGEVKFEGPLPKTMPINMAADPKCAMQHPGAVMRDDVMTGSGGGLGNVIVFVASGLGSRNFEVPNDPVVIQQKGCMYWPHVIAMRANQKLEVLNSDKTAHNIHPTPANNREWNKFQPPGSPLEETFPREEVAIPVRCNLHPWMRGYIAVFKHPFFAVTGKDGSFQLPSLPAGEYMVEAWHERLGTLTQKLTIAAGESKKIEFVFKSKPGN